MNLLCSSIIKAEDITLVGKKVVKSFSNNSLEKIESPEVAAQLDEHMKEKEEEIRLKLEDAQNQYQQIINDAKAESEKLIEDSKAKAQEIEKMAYEEGHEQGVKNGYEDGYKDVYEENIEKAKEEAKTIIDNANNILFEAKNEVVNYIKDNKTNIVNIAIDIAERVLREKFEDTSTMNKLLEEIIREYELKENFVIKVNPVHKESVDEQILNLKKSSEINSDVFVLDDETIDPGNAIIDNEKGRLVVGIDGVLDKIKEELI